MPGITLQQAQDQLDAWVAANLAVANGQSYSIGGRSLTRVNAAEILNQINFWERKVQRLAAGQGGIRVRYGAVDATGMPGGGLSGRTPLENR